MEDVGQSQRLRGCTVCSLTLSPARPRAIGGSFAVANKSYFVNDQIAFEPQLVQAVILRRAPIRGRIKFEYSGEGQDRVCHSLRAH